MANRLQKEHSPYLQQHKNNPFDWYPWCDEAFEKALAEEKAIFISIGYSSCHWCHVMEKEVFEDEQIAAFVNEHFVCIKVDREERPDVDKYYQEVYQLLNRRSGGWPTSIFCTPQNKPIFAGTYIPPNNSRGMAGFSEITSIIADKIAKQDEAVYKNADEIASFLKQVSRPKEATVLTQNVYKNFLLQTEKNFDEVEGGFSTAPKFPHTSTLQTLLGIYELYGEVRAKEMVLLTLEKMLQGGMYDLVEGGFCRYSTDREWFVPHFEKMTYDNALLCSVYLRSYRIFKERSFLYTAKEIADFMLQVMAKEHLFYSASDADSPEGEGVYFTYTYKELQERFEQAGFDAEQTKELLRTLHVDKFGNFEGRNIIRFEASFKEDGRYEKVMQILRDIRKEREYPFIDKKVQTSWNAMMVRSLFELCRLDANYIDKATAHLEALLAMMFVDGELYHCQLIGEKPVIKAFLEDYAYMGVALIEAYEVTGEERYLILAQRFANDALGQFYENGAWYFSRGEFTTLAEATDNTYPSATAVMVDLLLSLASFTEEKYRRFAFATLEYDSFEFSRKPLYFPLMTEQMLRYLKGDFIIKASSENLAVNRKKIAFIGYPYLRVQHNTREDFLLCGVNECFASASDIEGFETAIKERLS